ncbi:unnamed protein product [Cylicocyclus nassatus]|uniref:ShKT domain-containing protein n=1 Tax=Cylicocyclus nassatus TaxID=53992 RepID=A0AA36DKC4_CYLNA|nr:unnamed protein product [Cylicocyclus nassatus]
MDKVNPRTGVSDCTVYSYLCYNALYRQVMAEQCPKTCNKCPGAGNSASTSTCVDLVNPRTGVSDCTKTSSYCRNSLYQQLMREQCPRTWMKWALILVWFSFATAAPSSFDATYADDVARNKMLPLAAAAYAKNPQTCLTNKFTNAELKRQLNVKCDSFRSDKCSGFTAVLNGDKAIVLSFRGTDAFLQLVSESDQSVFSKQIAWIGGGKVSKYFNDAFMDVWNGGMKDDFNTLRAKYPTYQVWVTGHSLGGAMATLAASYLVAANLVPAANVELVTFGQPRTGNKDFSAAHDKQMSYTFRVTHSRDIVPHVPPEDLEGYYHHKYEAFYHNHMKPGASFEVCAADEDKGCSDGLDVTTSIDEHLHYFDVDVNVYGEKGCK